MENVDLKIANEIRSFDFVAQNIWPVARRVLKYFITERCKQCVISANAPGIELHGGRCNLCIEYNKNIYADEEQYRQKFTAHQQQELDQMFKTYQGKGPNRYDALVLFSGGKDSVYMLHRLRRDYPGLRLLLMTWDNGFYSAVALERAHEIAQKMDLDYIKFKPSSTVFKTLYQEHLRNFYDFLLKE